MPIKDAAGPTQRPDPRYSEKKTKQKKERKKERKIKKGTKQTKDKHQATRAKCCERADIYRRDTETNKQTNKQTNERKKNR